MNKFNGDDLLREVKRCKAAVVVFNDMNSICYGFPNCKSIDKIDELGALGVAFGDDCSYFYWIRNGESYNVSELKNKHMGEIILHHSIGNKTLKEVLEIE